LGEYYHAATRRETGSRESAA